MSRLSISGYIIAGRTFLAGIHYRLINTDSLRYCRPSLMVSSSNERKKSSYLTFKKDETFLTH